VYADWCEKAIARINLDKEVLRSLRDVRGKNAQTSSKSYKESKPVREE
jgi:hypothetical protein